MVMDIQMRNAEWGMRIERLPHSAFRIPDWRYDYALPVRRSHTT